MTAQSGGEQQAPPPVGRSKIVLFGGSFVLLTIGLVVVLGIASMMGISFAESGSAVAEQRQPEERTIVKWVWQTVNIREGRGTNTPVATQLQARTQVFVNDEENGWWAAYNGNGRHLGFIYNSLLRDSGTPPAWQGTFERWTDWTPITRHEMHLEITVTQSGLTWKRRTPLSPRSDTECRGTFTNTPSGTEFRVEVRFDSCTPIPDYRTGARTTPRVGNRTWNMSFEGGQWSAPRDSGLQLHWLSRKPRQF